MLDLFYFAFYLFGGCVRTQRTPPPAYGLAEKKGRESPKVKARRIDTAAEDSAEESAKSRVAPSSVNNYSRQLTRCRRHDNGRCHATRQPMGVLERGLYSWPKFQLTDRGATDEPDQRRINVDQSVLLMLQH